MKMDRHGQGVPLGHVIIHQSSKILPSANMAEWSAAHLAVASPDTNGMISEPFHPF